MEINNKYNYGVYSRYYMNTEDISKNILSDWRYEGSTRAVSEKKAINNVRCRNYGKTSSQYQPFEITGNYEKGYEWKAEMDEKYFNARMIYQILKDKEIIPKDCKLSNVGNHISIFKKELNIKEIRKDTTENGTMYYSKEDTKKIIEGFRKINYQKNNNEQIQNEETQLELKDINNKDSMEEISSRFKKAIEEMIEKIIDEKIKDVKNEIEELKSTNKKIDLRFENILENMKAENEKTFTEKLLSLVNFKKEK